MMKACPNLPAIMYYLASKKLIDKPFFPISNGDDSFTLAIPSQIVDSSSHNFTELGSGTCVNISKKPPTLQL
jgi:hypothetical protein